MALTHLITVYVVTVLTGCSIAWAECPKSGLIKLKLTADEFEVPGYDAERGILAIRPRTTLAANADRPRPIKLRLAQENVYVQIAPKILRLGLESGLGGLEVVLEATPVVRPLAANQAVYCDELIPKQITIQRAGLVIARTIINSAPKEKLTVSIRVKVSVERGLVQPKALILITQELAQYCADRMPHQGRGLKGALSIQIQTNVLGEAEMPKTVVDGLVNRPYIHCLIRAFRETPRLWRLLEPATRAYLTFYLQPGPGKDPAP
jgi:hypothetical protein